MKVILLRDVAKIGRRGQVVELPDGYALNQLIPKKWAEAATPTNLKKIANLQATAEAHDSAKQAGFDAAVTALAAQTLTVKGDANEKMHLFKAIHESDIVAAAKERGIALEARYIIIEAPIKSLGQHTIMLKHGGKKVPCVIEVISK